jgi:hypothetical protein
MGSMCDCGRDLDGTELAEYCESLFLEACDTGRGRLLRRDGVDVVNGDSAGWFGFGLGFGGEAVSAAGEAAGDEVPVMAAIAMAPRHETSGEPQGKEGMGMGEPPRYGTAARRSPPNSDSAWPGSTKQVGRVRRRWVWVRPRERGLVGFM